MRRHPHRSSVSLLVVALMSGCGASFFACVEAGDCSGGSCEPSGWCSFPDDACPSGARYGEHAGDGLAGTCVEGSGTGESGSGSATMTDPSDPTLEASSSPTTASSVTTSGEGSTASTGAPLPVCGDGLLEGDEACDDGNLVAGDGCSASCEGSGTVVWTLVIDGDPGTEAGAHALAQFPGGDLAVGFAVTLDGLAAPGVWRIRAASDIVWAWDFEAPAWDAALTWGLDVASVQGLERVAVAIDGYAVGQALSGVAMLDGDGATAWTDLVEGTLYGAAIEPSGEVVVVGTGPFGGQLVRFAADGTNSQGFGGEPYTPADGFAFDVVADGEVLYLAGQHGEPGLEIAFLGGTTGMASVRSEFAPALHNEGLAVAVDANSSTRWIAGYADGQGGWVGAIGPDGITLPATLVTDAFPANLHGIDVDGSGAAVAVGWDSPAGTRDAYVVKVAPDGARVWSVALPGPAGDDDLRDVEVTDEAIFVAGSRIGEDGSAEGFVSRLVP